MISKRCALIRRRLASAAALSPTAGQEVLHWASGHCAATSNIRILFECQMLYIAVCTLGAHLLCWPSWWLSALASCCCRAAICALLPSSACDSAAMSRRMEAPACQLLMLLPASHSSSTAAIVAASCEHQSTPWRSRSHEQVGLLTLRICHIHQCIIAHKSLLAAQSRLRCQYLRRQAASPEL